MHPASAGKSKRERTVSYPAVSKNPHYGLDMRIRRRSRRSSRIRFQVLMSLLGVHLEGLPQRPPKAASLLQFHQHVILDPPVSWLVAVDSSFPVGVRLVELSHRHPFCPRLDLGPHEILDVACLMGIQEPGPQKLIYCESGRIGPYFPDFSANRTTMHLQIEKIRPRFPTFSL